MVSTNLVRSQCCSCIHANSVIRALAICGVISVLWGTSTSYPRPNFKVHHLRRPFSRLIRECEGDDKLSAREFGGQFNIKMTTVVCFPVLRVIVTRGDRNERNHPCINDSHLHSERVSSQKKLHIFKQVYMLLHYISGIYDIYSDNYVVVTSEIRLAAILLVRSFIKFIQFSSKHVADTGHEYTTRLCFTVKIEKGLKL
jgi:hypothetical protein